MINKILAGLGNGFIGLVNSLVAIGCAVWLHEKIHERMDKKKKKG